MISNGRNKSAWIIIYYPITYDISNWNRENISKLLDVTLHSEIIQDAVSKHS